MNTTNGSGVKVFYTIEYRENVSNATRGTRFSSNTLSTVENPRGEVSFYKLDAGQKTVESRYVVPPYLPLTAR
jgi:hypothetical protein